MADEDTDKQAVDTLIKAAVAQINQDSISYGDLLDLVAQPPKPIDIPAQPPLPAQIKDEEKAALERLAEVFGSVVPAEVRKLEPAEITKLLDERGVLKTIEGMAKGRTDAIRTTVLNHNDTAIREEMTGDQVREVERDKDGHLIAKRQYRGESSTDQVFSCEPSQGKAQLDPNVLLALANDESVDWFTRADYLAMTRQVRVWDDAAAMLHLRKKPDLVRAVREAVVRGGSSISVQPRKA